MYRILVIVPFPMAEEQLALRRAQAAKAGLPPGVELVFRPVRAAPANYSSAADSALAEIGIIAAGAQAGDDGFDAVCIDTMSDSGMAALRAMLPIPVVGPGRVSMLTAAMLGQRFTILMMWDRWRHLYTKTLAETGLGHRCASMRDIGMTPDNRQLLAGKEDAVFPRLLAAARAAVEEDGAEVILLGSTTMHQAHDYLAERLPVPVIDPGPLCYRTALTLLSLGLSHAPAAYPAPLAPLPGMFAAMAAAGRPK
ncbi:MAG: hydrogenase expression protein HupH [Rhodobacteraceae bacterium]|nr:hydrogenase expression protein HupH [Paracoccaceae bacterium]